MKSHIYFNGSVWILQSLLHPEKILYSDQIPRWPLGRHNWFVEDNSSKICNLKPKSVIALTLSLCNIGESFTCNDGSCIPLR